MNPVTLAKMLEAVSDDMDDLPSSLVAEAADMIRSLSTDLEVWKDKAQYYFDTMNDVRLFWREGFGSDVEITERIIRLVEKEARFFQPQA